MNEHSDNQPVKSHDTVEVAITLDGVEHHIEWREDMTLLHALLHAGIEAPYSCGRGNCGTCVCKLEDGEVDLRRNYVLSEAHVQHGLILSCVSKPRSRKVRINYDQF